MHLYHQLATFYYFNDNKNCQYLLRWLNAKSIQAWLVGSVNRIPGWQGISEQTWPSKLWTILFIYQKMVWMSDFLIGVIYWLQLVIINWILLQKSLWYLLTHIGSAWWLRLNFFTNTCPTIWVIVHQAYYKTNIGCYFVLPAQGRGNTVIMITSNRSSWKIFLSSSVKILRDTKMSNRKIFILVV